MLDQSTESLFKRARAKYLSDALVIQLLDHNPHSFLGSSYSRTRGCNEVLAQNGQRLTATYCKNRWCATCNRIRMAKLINGYEPVLTSFKSPYFVTLTKQTVEAVGLADSIKLMNATWRTIVNDRYGRKQKIKGVRKAECTIRPNDKYHYHFHVIVEGKENAEWLVNRWLAVMGDLAKPDAQDIRVADRGSLKELFKYFTKLTAKGAGSLIDYKRMDVIFTALRGKRVYQPFGGVKPISEEIDDVQSVDYDFLENAQQLWCWDVDDWINDVEDRLTGHHPSDRLKAYFELKTLSET